MERAGQFLPPEEHHRPKHPGHPHEVVVPVSQPIVGLVPPFAGRRHIGRARTEAVTVENQHSVDGRSEILLKHSPVGISRIGERRANFVSQQRCVRIELTANVKREEPLNVIVRFLQPTVRFLNDLQQSPASVVGTRTEVEVEE